MSTRSNIMMTASKLSTGSISAFRTGSAPCTSTSWTARSHRNSSMKESEIKGLLLAGFATLLETLEGTKHITENVHFTITKCKQQIANDFANPNLSVKYLAELMGCSPDHLSNLFHRETGGRLTRHINNERVAKAKYLLKTTPLNISETARACGYRDPGYFTRIFHRVTGKTPRDFRNSR